MSALLLSSLFFFQLYFYPTYMSAFDLPVRLPALARSPTASRSRKSDFTQNSNAFQWGEYKDMETPPNPFHRPESFM